MLNLTFGEQKQIHDWYNQFYGRGPSEQEMQQLLTSDNAWYANGEGERIWNLGSLKDYIQSGGNAYQKSQQVMANAGISPVFPTAPSVAAPVDPYANYAATSNPYNYTERLGRDVLDSLINQGGTNYSPGGQSGDNGLSNPFYAVERDKYGNPVGIDLHLPGRGPGEDFYRYDTQGNFKSVAKGAKATPIAQGILQVALAGAGMAGLGALAAGGAAGSGTAMGAGAGLTDLGGGLFMTADGAIVGASSSLGAFPTNAGIMSSIGAGGSGLGELGALGADFGGNWFGSVPQGSGFGLSAGGELAPVSTYGGSSIGGGLGAGSGLSFMNGPMNLQDILKSAGTNLMGNSGGGGGMDWLGMATTALGALGGAQGQNASNTTSRSMDPRMDALFYGDLAPRTQGILGAQLPMAMGAGNQMLQVGSGLLGRTAPDTPTNPYLQGRADDIQRRTQDLLGQNNLAIQGNAVATGGLGGSRQGVAQGLAAGKAADYLQGNLAGMYGQAYDQDMGRLRQDWTIGSGLMSQGLNTQFAPLQNTANVYQPFTGFGSTTNSTQTGGGWQGALGGALGAAQMGKNMGWW